MKKLPVVLLCVIIAAATVAIALTGIYLYTKYVEPEITYQDAIANLESKNYDDAIKLFESLNNYKKSADYITEALYQKAISYAENEDYTAAIELFDELEDYKDSLSKRNESRYSLGLYLFNTEKYCECVEALSEISDYEDSQDYINKANYEYGLVLFSQENYEEASQYFFDSNCEDGNLYGNYCMGKSMPQTAAAYDYFMNCRGFLDTNELIDNNAELHTIDLIQGKWALTTEYFYKGNIISTYSSTNSDNTYSYVDAHHYEIIGTKIWEVRDYDGEKIPWKKFSLTKLSGLKFIDNNQFIINSNSKKFLLGSSKTVDTDQQRYTWTRIFD